MALSIFFFGSNYNTVFPRIIASGDYLFFAQKRGDYLREGGYLREAIISNIAHWKSCPNYFVLFSHEIEK